MNRERLLRAEQERFNNAGKAHTGCHPERSESEVEGSRETIFKLSQRGSSTALKMTLYIMLRSRFESRPRSGLLVCRSFPTRVLRSADEFWAPCRNNAGARGLCPRVLSPPR